MKVSAQIRYAILPSRSIFNMIAPNDQVMETFNNEYDFYPRLEESILKEGVRNPIIVRAGWCPAQFRDRLPMDMKDVSSRILICDKNGGSRLVMAQKHELDVPCIINDYIGRFEQMPELKDENDVLSYYKDKPKEITINHYGVRVMGIPQVHLKGEAFG